MHDYGVAAAAVDSDRQPSLLSKDCSESFGLQCGISRRSEMCSVYNCVSECLSDGVQWNLYVGGTERKESSLWLAAAP